MRLSNFIKPRYKHSNPKVRLVEVKNFSSEQLAALSEVALKDTDSAIRKVAIQKINSIEILLKIIEIESDSENKKIAINSYHSEAVKLIKKAESLKDIENHFNKISDEKVFEDILFNAKSEEIRFAALKKVSKENAIVKVAINENSKKIAMAALEKITKESAYIDLMHSAKLSSIRSAASAKNKKLKKDEIFAKDDSLIVKKKEVLLSSMKRLISDSALDNIESFKELKSEWSILDSEDNKEYTEVCHDFEKRCDDLRVKKEKKEQTEKENLEIHTKSLALCQKLEELVNLDLGGSSQEALNNIQAEWDALEVKASDEIKRRFEKTLERFENQLDEDKLVKKTLSEEEAHRKEILEQLSSLKEKEDLKSVEKQMFGLKKAWERMSDLVDTHDLQIKFSELVEVLSEKIIEEKNKREEDLTQVQEKLKEIIEEVKNIKENQDFKIISQQLRSFRISWRELVGDNKKHFKILWNDFKEAAAKFDEMRDWQHWHNERDCEDVCNNLENDIASLEGSKELYDLIRTHQNEWRALGPVSPQRLDEFRDRFSSACEKGFEKCSDWLDTQKVEREANLEEKSKLCIKVKEIIDSEKESWKDTANAVKELQSQWREIGPVPHEKSDEIWSEFKALCDAFYVEHREFLKTEEVVREANLKLKEKLCEVAETTAAEKRWKEGGNKFKELQAKWKEIGSVPKAQSDVIWKRFRKSCDEFFEAKREYFEKIDAEKAENLAKKEALCEELENMEMSVVSEGLKTKVDDLHKQWKEIGMVPKDDSDKIWQRFCDATDRFHTLYIENDPEAKAAMEEGLAQKQEIVQTAKDASEMDNMSEASRILKELQTKWKELGRSGNFDKDLWTEFREVCDDFFKRRRDQYDIMEQLHINNLEKKTLLCEQAEKAVASEDMFEAQQEVKHLRKLWKEIGQVPRKNSDAIWKRFQIACNSVFPKKEDES